MFSHEDRFAKGIHDIPLQTAQVVLEALTLSQLTLPVSQKRCFGLICLLDMLVRVLLSKTTRNRMISTLESILHASVFAVAPNNPTPIPDVKRHVLAKLFSVNKSSIRKQVTAAMREGIEDAHQIEELVNIRIVGAMKNAITEWQAIICSDLGSLKTVLSVPITAREKDWLPKTIVQALEWMAILLSIRDPDEKVDEAVIAQREKMLKKVLEFILLLVLPDHKFRARQLILLVDRMESLAIGHFNAALGPQRRIAMELADIQMFLDPDQL